MGETATGRRKIAAVLFLALLAGAAALFLPRWRPGYAPSPSEAPVGAGGVLPGSVTNARSRIDPGKSEKAVLDAIGKPSVAVETKGAERHTIWTYYYADGNLTLNMTDGYLVRVDTEYGSTRRGLKRD